MATYLALLVVIGVRALKAQGSPDEYFLGGRSIKTASLTVLWFASWIGGASLVATVNRAYTLGISAVWYVTALGVGCILFGLLFAARVKRLAESHQFLTTNSSSPHSMGARESSRRLPRYYRSWMRWRAIGCGIGRDCRCWTSRSRWRSHSLALWLSAIPLSGV